MAETAQRLGLGGGARALFGRVADTDSFDREITRLTEAAAGVLSCMLVDPPMGFALMRALGRRSVLAAAYLGVLDDYTRALETTRSRRDADGCLTCEGGAFFRSHLPTIIAVLTAAPGAVEASIVAGICERCARAAGWPERPWKSGLLAAMEPPLRQLWPQLRVLPVHPVAGCA